MLLAETEHRQEVRDRYARLAAQWTMLATALAAETERAESGPEFIRPQVLG